MSMYLAAADTYTLLSQAISNPTPEAPPGSRGLLKLVNWLTWFVTTAGVCGIVFAGGKMAFEKFGGGGGDAPKQIVGALIGSVIVTSASSIMNAVIANGSF